MNLTNFKNYYMYTDMVKGHNKKVYVPEDIRLDNIDEHITAITNILKDGIETPFIHNVKITVSWGEGKECRLSIVDYWYNLMMWSMVLRTKQEIKPKHIFWQKEMKKFSLKSYVDKFIIHKYNKTHIDDAELNGIICDGLFEFSKIENFSYYLANTINNEDDIDLMNKCPEFFDLLHCSLQGVPFEDVKAEGMKLTNRAIEIIKDSERIIGYEHALTNSFRASEAINPRQYKEASLNIGTKPNGSGDIYPYIIDKSFKTGGVNDPISYFIESSTARAAQIMSKTNVGDSGDFARLLGINNTDTILNRDMNYECMSRHYVKIELKTKKHVSMFKNRYYRFNPNGIDRLLEDWEDESMVGKTIYLHSPITCASKSSGNGICKRCYGDLYYTNYSINAGKIAAEILSSQLTQILLSAKHLLEARIVKIIWNKEFYTYFSVDANSIKLNSDNFGDVDLRRYTMIIDPEDVNLVNEYEDSFTDNDDAQNEIVNYNEYITKFLIKLPNGEFIEFGSKDQDPMYISTELNNIIRKRAVNSDNKIAISLASLVDEPLFFIKITNNEISKTMNDIINIIDKSSVTNSLTRDEALQSLVDLIIEGGLKIDAIHLETILSNQIVDPDDILKRPNWNNPNATYRMLTLNQALTNNPSIIVSLLYKDLKKTLYTPLSFKKNGCSYFDLFFCEDPQNYMSDELLEDKPPIRDPEKDIIIASVVNKKPKETIVAKVVSKNN